MKALFDHLSLRCSRSTTHLYSTSFTIGIKCLHRRLRDPIYSIYGFVRLADEIVDSFHQYNQPSLLERFRRDTWEAIEEKISLNPILNAYQATVHQFMIPPSLTELFLKSMSMDLNRRGYDETGLQEYICGSAEAVGLMCLRVFCNGDETLYERLKGPAARLGSAFQKINFLRDLRADTEGLGRHYFPCMQGSSFTQTNKIEIEADIKRELDDGFEGITQLPRTARFGVYVAYMYYLALFGKIKNTPAEQVMQTRIRIPDRRKATLLAWSYVKHQLNLI